MRTRILILTACVLFVAAPTRAELYEFRCITNTSATNAGVGAAQFSVEVTQGLTENQVLFRFANTGSEASAITDIYFYDGVLLGYSPPAGLTWSDGVSFSEGAAPGDLPGLLKDGVTRVFSADSDVPVQPNGVNPGEWMQVLFNLDRSTFADVIDGLNLGVTDPTADGSIQIGIHAQSFADGGSESFVHAPLPAAVLLGALGLAAAGVKLRKYV